MLPTAFLMAFVNGVSSQFSCGILFSGCLLAPHIYAFQHVQFPEALNDFFPLLSRATHAFKFT